MSRIGNKDLAMALTEKHGLSKKDAEKFVVALFNVINDALTEEKLVKVKGLGTFKVISVAPRKSVDVNTGEPIVIEGRDKISFVPDASLRDEVNKPFSQFDTVIVNDGIDFSAIDKKYEGKDNGEETVAEQQEYPKEDVKSSNGIIEDDAISSTDNEVTSTENKDVTADSNNKVPDDKAEVETTGITDKDTPTTEESEKPVISDEEEIEQTEKNKFTDSEEVKENEIEVEENLTDTEETKTENNDTEIEDKETGIENEEADVNKPDSEKEQGKERSILRMVLAACITLFITCVVGGFYMYSQLQKRDNRIAHLEAQVENVSLKKAQQKTTKKVVKPVVQSATVKVEKNTVKTTANIEDTNEKAASQDVTADESVNNNYDSDPRVRTGAYKIIGIEKTITVKEGQTLNSISHFYFGPDMECYVEAVNDGRKEFKAGEKIRIPKLAHKKSKKK